MDDYACKVFSMVPRKLASIPHTSKTPRVDFCQRLSSLSAPTKATCLARGIRTSPFVTNLSQVLWMDSCAIHSTSVRQSHPSPKLGKETALTLFWTSLLALGSQVKRSQWQPSTWTPLQVSGTTDLANITCVS